MQNYESLIYESLPGETPKAKYDHLIKALERSNKWEALEEKIGACYVNEDDTENEDPSIGLDTIGEMAAAAFGFL